MNRTMPPCFAPDGYVYFGGEVFKLGAITATATDADGDKWQPLLTTWWQATNFYGVAPMF